MSPSRRGRSLAALVALTGAFFPGRAAAAPVPTKVSPASVSIDEQFSLTVEVPGGCDMASINSEGFAIVTSRDFRTPRQYPHLQPTGHVHELTPGFGSYSGFNQANTQASAQTNEPARSASHLRTYVLKANRAGPLTLGPFQVLCPDGPLETQVQTVEVREKTDGAIGTVVGIQDFSAARSAPAAAPPAADPAAFTAQAKGAPVAPADDDQASDLTARLSALFSERNLLVLAVVGLGTTVLILLLRGPEKKL